jgi:hypothetical protein
MAPKKNKRMVCGMFVIGIWGGILGSWQLQKQPYQAVTIHAICIWVTFVPAECYCSSYHQLMKYKAKFLYYIIEKTFYIPVLFTENIFQ